VPLSHIVVRGDDGRWQQIAKVARGGGTSILIVFAGWVLDALNAPADQAGRTFVLLDTARSCRSAPGGCSAGTAPAIDSKLPVPDGVPRPPQNTFYKRIDLNRTSVRDFGRHGQDLDRVCEDIREDFSGAHGIADIDRRVHSTPSTRDGRAA